MKKISIFLRDTDRIFLKRLASIEGENMSVLIRRLIKEEIRRSNVSKENSPELITFSKTKSQQ